MTSKTLTSGIAAAALVGAIGFAYAQTSDSGTAPAVPATTPATTQAPAPMTDAAPTAQPSINETTSTAERDALPPQADRN